MDYGFKLPTVLCIIISTFILIYIKKQIYRDIFYIFILKLFEKIFALNILLKLGIWSIPIFYYKEYVHFQLLRARLIKPIWMYKHWALSIASVRPKRIMEWTLKYIDILWFLFFKDDTRLDQTLFSPFHLLLNSKKIYQHLNKESKKKQFIYRE